MDVLITGINGFAGSHLAELLLKKGINVHGVIHSKDSIRNISQLKGKIRTYEGDIRDRLFILTLLGNIKPQAIFHLAALTHVPTAFKEPQLTVEINVIGTLNLLEAVVESKIYPRIMYVSSSEVYGSQGKGIKKITEDVLPNPLGPYSVSKYTSELLVKGYISQRGLDIIIMRPFNHIGPRQLPGFVVSSFSRQIAIMESKKDGPKEIKVGNLDIYKDFTDVRDIVRGYWLAYEKGKTGRIYNICSGNAVKIEDILKKLLECSSNQDIKVRQEKSRLRRYDVPIVLGSYTLLAKDTGWIPEVSIDRSLVDSLEYWRGVE